MSSNDFFTPVLFIIFNRSEHAQRVFQKIKKVKPKYLFVAADGPRVGVDGEEKECNAARNIIQAVDWDCEVKTLFRDENLGCGKAISSAIDWFFDHVEEGIILEDDCVPDDSFFYFCQRLLKDYKDHENVMMISGTSYFFNKVNRKESFFFSKYYSIWGWATWRRAWKFFEYDIEKWDSKEVLGSLEVFLKDRRVREFWVDNLKKVCKKDVDTWDYQWAYACIKQQGFSIVSVVNLVSNIGFSGAHGNGTKSIFHQMPVRAIESDLLVAPNNIQWDKSLDKKLYDVILTVMPKRSIFSMGVSVVKKALKFCIPSQKAQAFLKQKYRVFKEKIMQRTRS